MKNVVSFAVAQLLKANGFPQPEQLERGQCWYDQAGKRYMQSFHKPTPINTVKHYFDCYAPTVPEILDTMTASALAGCGILQVADLLEYLNNPDECANLWLISKG